MTTILILIIAVLLAIIACLLYALDESKEMAKLNKDIADLQSGDPKALQKHTNMHEMYKRLAGETEARNVTDRRRMTGEERIAKPSWETQEYPFLQQFIARQSGK